MKLTDMVIAGIIKRGIIFEARNFETDVEIPETNVTVKIRAEHLTVRVDKDEAE